MLEAANACGFQLNTNAATAILIALQFLIDTGNVIVIILHVTTQNSHLAIQLLMGCFHHTHL